MCRCSSAAGSTPTAPPGLIALSGAAEGDVGRAILTGREADALALAREWQALFGDRYYLELQRLGRSDDETHVARCVSLSQKTGIPVVATNDVRFLAASDFESHEARVCIAEGAQLADPGRTRRYTEAQHLRSPADMARIFADIPGSAAQHRGDRAPLLAAAQARRVAPAELSVAGRRVGRGVHRRGGRARLRSPHQRL